MHGIGSGPKLLAGVDPLSERLAAGLDATCELLCGLVPSDLHAIVLTGSLARGDGATVQTPTGPCLVSDVDLYVLVDNPDRLDAAALRRAVAELLESHVGRAVVDLGVVGPDHFASLGSKLPARQMSFGARVLYDAGSSWTRPVRLDADAPIPVDPDDALRLLQNRMGEGLLRRREGSSDVARFHRWKLGWDAPLAFLASAGAYHPDRPTQWTRLQSLLGDRDPEVDRWLEAGLGRLREMWSTLAGGPIPTADLIALGGVAEAEDPTGPSSLRSWVWPFLRSMTAGAGRPATPSDLVDAVRAGEPSAADLALVSQWLRRRGVARTLRGARRWARVGPATRTPWWRYGRGGTGPERVLGAASLRWGGVAGWQDPVLPLHGPRTPQDPAEQDRWLGQHWSEWITGGARR